MGSCRSELELGPSVASPVTVSPVSCPVSPPPPFPVFFLIRPSSFKVYVGHSVPDCFFLSLYTFVVLYLFRTYAMVLGRGSMSIGCHPALWAVNACFYLVFIGFTTACLVRCPAPRGLLRLFVTR